MKIKIITINGLNQSVISISKFINTFSNIEIIEFNSQKRSSSSNNPQAILNEWKKNLYEQFVEINNGFEYILIINSMALPIYLSIYNSIKNLNLTIAKYLLFAPLVKLNTRTFLLLSLSKKTPSFMNHLKVKSKNTQEQQLKNHCTIGEYKAVFLLYKDYNPKNYSVLLNNSVCFINKKDELMNSIQYNHYFDNLYYVKNCKRYHQLFIHKNYPVGELERIFNVINQYVNFSLLSLTKLDYDKS